MEIKIYLKDAKFEVSVNGKVISSGNSSASKATKKLLNYLKGQEL